MPSGALVEHLTGLLTATRATTEWIVATLGDDDLHLQPIDFLSPVVWDVAHVGNFEESWLVDQLGGARLTTAAFSQLYDAFEQPRGVRGGLPLLGRVEAGTYLAEVRAEALSVLRRLDLDCDDPLLRDGYLHRMIAQHESQHQETMVQSLALRDLPLEVGERPDGVTGATRRRRAPDVDDRDRVVVPAGPFVLGTDEHRWAYDNERTAHVVDLPGFVLDRYPVTCRRYAAFVADGGYERPELWTERGWQWRTDTGHRTPQGWQLDASGAWWVRRFGRLLPLDPAEPVQHVSWFEADAFARWDGGRLPTEAEWEKAASWDPRTSTKRRHPWGDAPPTPVRANVGLRTTGPEPVGSRPAGASAYGVHQLAGDVYEWTSSPFSPYPGFVAFPYREYSEVFFGGDYRVLRGSSWAIAAPFARATYRNWDHPYRRQVLAGIRVARDLPGNDVRGGGDGGRRGDGGLVDLVDDPTREA